MLLNWFPIPRRQRQLSPARYAGTSCRSRRRRRAGMSSATGASSKPSESARHAPTAGRSCGGAVSAASTFPPLTCIAAGNRISLSFICWMLALEKELLDATRFLLIQNMHAPPWWWWWWCWVVTTTTVHQLVIHACDGR